MKTVLLLFCSVTFTAQSAVLLDDDWDDGNRTDTNLPEESAWFGNTVAGAPTLSAAPNALTGHVRVDANTSSRLWITHFTPAGSPAELAVGETLKVTFNFIPRIVATAPGVQRGLRIGVFNFSGPGAARAMADGFSTGGGGGAPGLNVTGYMLNMNFAQAFTANNPLQLMKRIDMTTNNLMGVTSAYASMGNGGGPNGSPGFSNDVPYTLEFSIRRLSDATVQITTTFSDTNGWSISHSVTDTDAHNFGFDGFAIRPNSVGDSAESFTFTRLKVEKLPFEARITSARFVDSLTLELQWDSLPGKTYEVQARLGLEPGYTWGVLTTVPSQGASTIAADGDAGFELQKFYRIFQLP